MAREDEIGLRGKEQAPRLNNIEALGQDLLREKLVTPIEELALGLGKVVAKHKERDFGVEGPVTEVVPPKLVEITPHMDDQERERLWRRWCFRVGEQAVSPSNEENILTLLKRAVGSLQNGQLPELTPFTAGSVAWWGKAKGAIKDTTLQFMGDIYNAATEDDTETREKLMNLSKDILADKTINSIEKKTILNEIKKVLTTQGKRLDANEGKGALKFTPEFPKTPEQYGEIVRSALVDFVDTDVLENISHGWNEKIVITTGFGMRYTLGDKAIEADPVARTPIEIRDSSGKVLEKIPLYDYLRREVNSAEAVTLAAYSYKTCNQKDKVSQVVGLEIPNSALDALGKMLSTDLSTNIGDEFGRLFEIYTKIAKGDKSISLGSNKNFFREGGISRVDEKKTREWIRSTYLSSYPPEDATLLESLALNLTYAWGYGSDASSTGTMSATERATWLDRVFKTDVWRNKKRHSAGPRSTVGSTILPRQLLMPAPELVTVVRPYGGKDYYYTLGAVLAKHGYRFRDAGLSTMAEIDHRFKVAILDAVSFFEDETTPPDSIKAVYGGFHKIAEHTENAMNPSLVFKHVETGHPNGVNGVEKKVADDWVGRRAADATIEVFRGLHKEARESGQHELAGQIQTMAKRVTGKTV